MSEMNAQQAVDGIKRDIIKSYEGRATTLTGDPVDPRQLETEQGSQARGLTKEMVYVDDAPWVEGTVNHNSPGEVDEFSIPGLDPEALAPNGVDAAADDSGCEGGACKI